MANQGEIWAKLDAGTEAYYREINRTKVPFARILDNLAATARRWPITIQTSVPGMARAGARRPGSWTPTADACEGILARAGDSRASSSTPWPAPPPSPRPGPAASQAMDDLARRVRAALPDLPVEVFYGPENRAGAGSCCGVWPSWWSPWAPAGCSRTPGPPPPVLPVRRPPPRLVAVGDILMHQDVKRRRPRGPGRPARPCGRTLEPLFQGAPIGFRQPGDAGGPHLRPAGCARSCSTHRRTCPGPSGPAASRCSRWPTTTPTTRAPRACLEPWTGCGEQPGAGGHRRRAGPRRKQPQIVQCQGLRVALPGLHGPVQHQPEPGRASGPWVRPLDPDAAVDAVRGPGPWRTWWW